MITWEFYNIHHNHRYLPVFPHPFPVPCDSPSNKEKKKGKRRKRKQGKKARFVLSMYSLDMITFIVVSPPAPWWGGSVNESRSASRPEVINWNWRGGVGPALPCPWALTDNR